MADPTEEIMNNTLRVAAILMGAVVMVNAPRAMAQEAPTPASNPSGSPDPTYPIKYHVPSVEEISKTLASIRERLENASPAKLVDSKTHEEVTDYSKPASTAFEHGHDKNFPQISYPMGVVYLLDADAARATGDQKFVEFDNKRFEIFAKAFPAMDKWPAEDTGRGNPFTGLLHPSSLDSCGAMAASMAKANRLKIGPDLSPITSRAVEWVSHQQFRLQDGTLARKRPRPESVWADDMYMGVPLLARTAAATNNKELFDDCVKQVVQINEKLFVKSTGLYTHGWAGDNIDNHPRHYWGRANGWCTRHPVVELLDLLPTDHPGHDQLIQILRSHAQGLAEVQSGNGMWHQVLDRPDSYLETSCTAMFSYAMAKGVNHGWLDAPTALGRLRSLDGMG